MCCVLVDLKGRIFQYFIVDLFTQSTIRGTEKNEGRGEVKINIKIRFYQLREEYFHSINFTKNLETKKGR